MRICGLAFILLSIFAAFARAQTPPPDPGAYLLHAIKAVADSGRADDAPTVGALLHLSFIQTGHSVWGAGNSGCLPGGHQVEDTYAVTGDNWFHSLPTGQRHMIIQIPFQPLFDHDGKQREMTLGDPKITYDIRGALHCADLSQNTASGEIEFNNIPAYACISKTQVDAIFPKLRPGDISPDGDGLLEDFSYRASNSAIEFHMTLHPGMIDPHHEPICLMDMQLFIEFQFGPSHKPDFDAASPVGGKE